MSNDHMENIKMPKNKDDALTEKEWEAFLKALERLIASRCSSNRDDYVS